MRKLQTLVFTALLLPFFSFGQFNIHAPRPEFKLGITGGFSSMHYLTEVFRTAPGLKQKGPVQSSGSFGYTGTVKVLLHLHKWQFGVGVEGGSLRSTLYRDIAIQYELENNYGYSIYITQKEIEKQRIASAYVLSNAFAHFKFNFGDVVSMYIGPTGGRMFSGNDLDWDSRSGGWMAGGNLGVTVRLSDRISLDLTEGFRMVWMRGNVFSFDMRQWYNPKVVDTYTNGNGQQFDMVALSVNSYNFGYSLTNLGINITL